MRVPKSCNYYYNKDSPLTGIYVLFRILAILFRQHHGDKKKNKQLGDMFSLIWFFVVHFSIFAHVSDENYNSLRKFIVNDYMGVVVILVIVQNYANI